MAGSQRTVQQWLAKNQEEMICCPYQPGNLMISKKACSKRHWISQKEKELDLMKGDFYHYAYKKGLSLCRECPIGKKLASSHPANESDLLPSANKRPGKSWGKLHFQRLS